MKSMNSTNRLRCGSRQQGAVPLEVAFSLMPIVFAIMFFIGIGHTMGTKQHAVMAARFTTATYIASRNGGSFTQPSDQVVGDAVYNSSVEPFTVTTSPFSSSAEFKRDGVDIIVLKILNLIFSPVDSPAGFAATSKPNRGLLARGGNLPDAESRFYMTKGTWTCTQTGGSGYLGAILGNIDFLDSFTDNGCCKTYDGR